MSCPDQNVWFGLQIKSEDKSRKFGRLAKHGQDVPDSAWRPLITSGDLGGAGGIRNTLDAKGRNALKRSQSDDGGSSLHTIVWSDKFT